MKIEAEQQQREEEEEGEERDQQVPDEAAVTKEAVGVEEKVASRFQIENAPFDQIHARLSPVTTKKKVTTKSGDQSTRMSDASTRDQSERRPHEEQEEGDGEEQEQQQLLLPHNTAAHALAMETIALVNQGDTAYTLDLQAQIYKCLDATQQTLHSFNNYSEDLYRRYQRDMEMHTRTMKEMKRDLEYIFKKTRMLKDRLDSSHPIPEED